MKNLRIPPVIVLFVGILPIKPPPEHMSCSIVWGAHFKNSGSVHLWLVGSLSSAEYELAMCYKKNWFNKVFYIYKYKRNNDKNVECISKN